MSFPYAERGVGEANLIGQKISITTILIRDSSHFLVLLNTPTHEFRPFSGSLLYSGQGSPGPSQPGFAWAGWKIHLMEPGGHFPWPEGSLHGPNFIYSKCCKSDLTQGSRSFCMDL